MSEELVRDLISTSDMIINGYAFNRLGENVRIVNALALAVQRRLEFRKSSIVQDYYRRNSKFMAIENA